ncbi:hypothetical protein SLEP1_g17440 [Rubroshorea leprosula]|uniref:Uncharacterized protein n=1 Tax=Rubroshorea leprosula TaxID=152421 RepID=A0AAV5IY09_9ROSI|nr:hypothetical protein SLEP1_g17440 [Rubroshorea leprosula]
MATSAFKSTSKRTSIGKSAEDSSSFGRTSSNRRARSLSRFSRRPPQEEYNDDESTPAPPTRGRFVNKVRGSGFPEISLDDLAIELFDSSLRRRSNSRNADVSPRNGGGGESVTQRRGRSVSRHTSRSTGGNSGAVGRGVSESANSRRRRSVSVARYQISDSESDLDHTHNSSNHGKIRSSTGGKSQIPSTHKPTALKHNPGLRRSLSQRDLKCQDDYSSHSSALTDDEGKDAFCCKNGIEKTIRAVYAQKRVEHPTGDLNTELYEAMRKELRNAVEEIKTELEQNTKNPQLANNDFLQSENSDVLQAVSTIRRKYAAKLEKSEKRKQDLLAEILLEEQHGKELTKIFKELLPDTKNLAAEKPTRIRKKSNDKNRMSKRLTEEAEKYIEDFISNVEDTDISSLDGERSDTSSSLGGITKTPTFQRTPIRPVPAQMDGVVLPWLQWETSNDASPLPSKNNWDATQGAKDSIIHTASSRGSWSPFPDCPSVNKKDSTRSSLQNQFPSNGTKRLLLDVDDYLQLKSCEDLLYETWSQRHRICSGGLSLCSKMYF